MSSKALAIVYRPPADLVPYARNARTHSDAQVRQIAASIKKFGWTSPVLVDADDGIIAGHGRVLAAQQLGMQTIPVIVLGHLSKKEKAALVLADNKIAENSAWDENLLREELALIGADFDMDALGFGWDDGTDSKTAVASVAEIATSRVADRFWIAIRGPLVDQALALQRLTEYMREYPNITVTLGTTPIIDYGEI